MWDYCSFQKKKSDAYHTCILVCRIKDVWILDIHVLTIACSCKVSMVNEQDHSFTTVPFPWQYVLLSPSGSMKTGQHRSRW